MSDLAASPAHLVREFHASFGLPARTRPCLPDGVLATQRQALLEEETREVAQAVAQRDLAQIARELADVVYVAYGTALAFGVDLDEVVTEVHRANMSKLGPDGLPRIENGKVQKGERFRPPDVAGVLERQRVREL
jgi:predicted HAD superfamily Cof-like phosphohydrolase